MSWRPTRPAAAREAVEHRKEKEPQRAVSKYGEFDFANLPVNKLVVHPNLGIAIENLFLQAEASILGTAYIFDYPRGAEILREKSRLPGFDLRILVDEGQMKKPSSARQKAVVRELLEDGVDIKTVRPPHGSGPYSIMHVKSWVIDGEIYIGGSMNFSKNSVTNNYETLVIIKDAAFVHSHLEFFHEMASHGQEIQLS